MRARWTTLPNCVNNAKRSLRRACRRLGAKRARLQGSSRLSVRTFQRNKRDSYECPPDAESEVAIAARFTALAAHLNERHRRLWAGAEARALGRGGIAAVARATGVSRPAIYRALDELDEPPTEGRVRRPGGGRKKLSETDPELARALDALLDPDSRGDPMSPLRWTCKSTAQLALAPTRGGQPVSADTVGSLLHEAGYSLQANRKTREGAQHPDRDAQFELHQRAGRAASATGGCPAISVDTKKKELVGEFKNGGREWRPQGPARRGRACTTSSTSWARPPPTASTTWRATLGWVSVGIDHDTATFAVREHPPLVARDWAGRATRRPAHCSSPPTAAAATATACACGSANCSALADETGLAITVCHLPPGTSKWNKIEHRLFSLHQHELARPPPHQPRGHDQPHLRDDHQAGPAGACRARPRQLSAQHHRQRSPNERDAPHRAQLSRRTELHDRSRPLSSAARFVTLVQHRALSTCSRGHAAFAGTSSTGACALSRERARSRDGRERTASVYLVGGMPGTAWVGAYAWGPRVHQHLDPKRRPATPRGRRPACARRRADLARRALGGVERLRRARDARCERAVRDPGRRPLDQP